MKDRTVVLSIFIAALFGAACFLNHPPKGFECGVCPCGSTLTPSSDGKSFSCVTDPLPSFPPKASVPPPPSAAPSPIEPSPSPSPSPLCSPGTHLHVFSEDPFTAMCEPDASPSPSASPVASPTPTPQSSASPPGTRQLGITVTPSSLRIGQHADIACSGDPAATVAVQSAAVRTWVDGRQPFTTPIPPGRQKGSYGMQNCMSGADYSVSRGPASARVAIIAGPNGQFARLGYACTLVAFCGVTGTDKGSQNVRIPVSR